MDKKSEKSKYDWHSDPSGTGQVWQGMAAFLLNRSSDLGRGRRIGDGAGLFV